MDDIHVYLPTGMRVVISEPESSFAWYDFEARLQTRKWYGWKTVQVVVIKDTKVTELEGEIDAVICKLLALYEEELSRTRAVKAAKVRLQTIFHGKVRDVKCPPKEVLASDQR
ncbi:hypothetical protein I532_04190 [Brevibacillus borstelensis AK1]|uniref:Uncharacterized protein n=1 Tax=Brevibacillus borstelensis AK1 TaxID=1300222 RepID=M8E687_9BACL|nr:hypothetical protein [Brevibacillus borstelensis]EMT54776.1 hypothetical protein I532_04190 [Brevibacillus borstelensis AK1]